MEEALIILDAFVQVLLFLATSALSLLKFFFTHPMLPFSIVGLVIIILGAMIRNS